MANPLFDALFAPLAGRHSRFLILPDGREISGDAFARRIAQMAGALRAAGLQPGDRLAVQVAKSPDALAVYGAAVAAGVVLLPLNTAYTPEEVRYFVADSGARLVLLDPAAATARIGDAPVLTLDAAGQGSFADLARTQPDAFSPVARHPDDLAALLYTSGTTGRSKGAMLSQRNLLSNAQVLARVWQFGAADVLLHALPIFHTHGLFVASNVVLLTGGAMQFLPGFDAGTVQRMLPQASVMMGVPTFYTRLLAEDWLTADAVAHMRLFISGSAPLLPETHAEFARRTGHDVLERYGMTETSMNTSNPYDGPRRAGTVGLPLPGVEVRLSDDHGDPVPPGQPGMIEVRGPNVFQGYWQMPEKTAAELRANGFFITGDLGMLDADGYLSIVGRQKDLVISGGTNIYPVEVEALLDAAPGVLESAVIGVPHPDLGEAVLAVLVPKPGATPDIAAILAGLQGRIARFKQPRAGVVVAALPRNAMGKVQKAELRKNYANWFSDGPTEAPKT